MRALVIFLLLLGAGTLATRELKPAILRSVSMLAVALPFLLPTILAPRPEFQGLRGHIQQETIITPHNWERDLNIFYGAPFSLAHSLDQMLCFRPRNRFEEIGNCFLVGGGCGATPRGENKPDDRHRGEKVRGGGESSGPQWRGP